MYVAFSKLFEATGNSFWQNKAEHAREFVAAMWDSTNGYFCTGTTDDGITINKDVIPLDAQTWGLLALEDTARYGRAIVWATENCAFSEICSDTCGQLSGFDFNPDQDGIWWEGTAQMVAAYKFLGDTTQANVYLNELHKVQTCAPNNNYKGIVAACHDGVSTGFDWVYNNRLHIGATCWFIFAELGYNPFWGTSTVTEIDEVELGERLGLPEAFQVSQNYPNPFNPETTIEYRLPEKTDVLLIIYNSNGQLVRTLVNKPQQAGYYTISWNGMDERGAKVASGLYLFVIKIGRAHV